MGRSTHEAYPSGQSQITVLQFTIAPHTVMTWHSHPMPSAGYVLAGPRAPKVRPTNRAALPR